ncbi:hypothetical protein ACHAXA_001841 [Cyclostephanos tholiformis]|uniref:PH domain-containing protein n=1 Tax=Cyclostephanos tholiformis TaxID=382380 RepID=A0ABD3R8W7_9STRA
MYGSFYFDRMMIDEADDAYIGSDDDSQEPYFHVETGKVVPAREAWAILASEGHPRFRPKMLNDGTPPRSPHRYVDDAVFRSFNQRMEENVQHLPMVEESSSFSGPTQQSIDMALHAGSPNYISPNKDLKKLYKIPSMDGHNSDDEDGETDPIILRAKAMALAAQNGLKLTPEQMQLIAQPDVQQQKLIEEAKRAQRAKELQLSQQKWIEFQQIGAEFTKFIQTEKEKPPLQWGSDLGKFIESQSLKLSNPSTHGQGADNSSVGVVGGGDGNVERSNDSAESTPGPSPPGPRKKMEGFGSTPMASPSRSAEEAPQSLVKGLWPNMTMPVIPMLNESITSILPGAIKGEGPTSTNDAICLEDPVCMSAILWKRRSGFGKLGATKSWERRLVELRGSRLIYYRTVEEKDEEDRAGRRADVVRNAEYASKPPTPNRFPDEAVGETDGDEKSLNTSSVESSTSLSSSQRIGILFGQAAQAAEQRIETAKKEFTRMASSGIESLKPAESPHGVMDMLKENATVSVSMGHSSSPTPFCLSIMAKSETKWEFAFASHVMMIKWISALTDVIVKARVDEAAMKSEHWEMDEYFIQRGVEKIDDRDESKTVTAALTTATTIAPTEQPSVVKTAASRIRQIQWSISGTNLYIAWASANIALILARCSSTTIDQYWKIVLFTNVGLWQLCSRPLRSNEIGANDTVQTLNRISTTVKKGLYKPMAGTTVVQATKVDDPNFNKDSHRLPTWVPISSSCLDVRSHGYLTTKKKIPSPGELYECIAVDCFVSNARVPEIAPRVKFGREFNIHSTGKTWKSPDIFVVSISIPTEAPNFGKSSDDGPGATIVGYFRMKEETRTILRRITENGYDPSVDISDADIDVQKRITNGVRLWERYCQEAPSNPTFQARFKLIPLGNLEELGCPGYISKYNGKPVLIKRNQVTGFFNDYPSLNCMEFDISLHPFPYLFKQGMAYMKDYYDRTVWTFGFVIEGRSNDELPEVVIGAMKLCHPNPKFIVGGDDFFEGTCANHEH